MPGKGSIKMTITYTIVKKAKCGKGNKCVVLNYVYDLDSGGLDEAFNDMAIEGDGVRVLDPQTMIIYKDDSRYTMSMTTDFMGQSIKMINEMNTSYSIEVH